MINYVKVLVAIAIVIFPLAMAEDCSSGRNCPNNGCCSQWGYCGCTADYCGSGCKGQCNWCKGGGGGSGDANGEATFYSPYVPSSCYGFDTSPFPAGNLIAAASSDIFNNKALCGAFYDITCKGAVSGAAGGCTGNPTVRVKVVDLCPGCHPNSFDLSYEAFSRIANLDVGRIKIYSTRVQGLGAVSQETEEAEVISQVV